MFVNAGQVRAFVKAASVARQCKVVGIVAAVVLTGNDVVDVKGPKGRVGLSQSAVFAATSGAAPYQTTYGAVYQDAGGSMRTCLAFACRMEIRSIAST